MLRYRAGKHERSMLLEASRAPTHGHVATGQALGCV